MLKKEILKKYNTIATHPGWDADNVYSIGLLLLATDKKEYKIVHLTKAGDALEGAINIDTGKGVYVDDKVVIDHHQDKKYKNAAEALFHNIEDIKLDVPKDVVSKIDNPTAVPFGEISILNSKIAEAFAEAYKFTEYVDSVNEYINKPLDEEAIKNIKIKVGLDITDIYNNIKNNIENIISAVEGGYKFITNGGHKGVSVNKFVPGGAQAAYSLGYDIYVSFSPHKDGEDKYTYTICGKAPLPQELLNIAYKHKEKYGENIYISSKNDMIVAGGPKNPEFGVDIESIKDIKDTIKKYIM